MSDTKFTGSFGSARRLCWVGIACLALATLEGCRRELDIPPREVKVVDAYGVKLDAAASPKQVVYVLLHALRDDVEASQAWDKTKKKQAFQTTFALAAFDAIKSRIVSSPELLKAGDGDVADAVARNTYDAIDHWAPIVGYYIRSFDVDAQAAMEKMTEVVAPDGRTGKVYVDVAHDPQATQPAARQEVTLVVDMAREKGIDGGDYWRVIKLGYHPKMKVISPAANAATATAPATAPSK